MKKLFVLFLLSQFFLVFQISLANHESKYSGCVNRSGYMGSLIYEEFKKATRAECSGYEYGYGVSVLAQIFEDIKQERMTFIKSNDENFQTMSLDSILLALKLTGYEVTYSVKYYKDNQTYLGLYFVNRKSKYQTQKSLLFEYKDKSFGKSFREIKKGFF